MGQKGLPAVLAALFVQTSDLVQQLDLADRVQRVPNHDLVDKDQLGPVGAMLVDRLQDGGDVQLVLRQLDQVLKRNRRCVV